MRFLAFMLCFFVLTSMAMKNGDDEGTTTYILSGAIPRVVETPEALPHEFLGVTEKKQIEGYKALNEAVGRVEPKRVGSKERGVTTLTFESEREAYGFWIPCQFTITAYGKKKEIGQIKAAYFPKRGSLEIYVVGLPTDKMREGWGFHALKDFVGMVKLYQREGVFDGLKHIYFQVNETFAKMINPFGVGFKVASEAKGVVEGMSLYFLDLPPSAPKK